MFKAIIAVGVGFVLGGILFIWPRLDGGQAKFAELPSRSQVPQATATISVSAAYQAIPHRRTSFDSSDGAISDPEARVSPKNQDAFFDYHCALDFI